MCPCVLERIPGAKVADSVYRWLVFSAEIVVLKRYKRVSFFYEWLSYRGKYLKLPSWDGSVQRRLFTDLGILLP